MTTNTSLPINATASEVNTIIADAGNVILTTVETYLQAQLPALDLPVIKQMANELESLLMGKLVGYIQTGATGLVTDMQGIDEVDDLGEGGTDDSADAQNALVADDGIAPNT